MRIRLRLSLFECSRLLCFFKVYCCTGCHPSIHWHSEPTWSLWSHWCSCLWTWTLEGILWTLLRYHGGNLSFRFSVTIAESCKQASLLSCSSRVNCERNLNKRGTESMPFNAFKGRQEKVSVELQQRRRWCETHSHTHTPRVFPSDVPHICELHLLLLRCDCLTWVTKALGRT